MMMVMYYYDMFCTVSYFYDIFVRFILFLALYFYHVKYNFVHFIIMNLQLDEFGEGELDELDEFAIG